LLLEVLSAAAKFRHLEFPNGAREFAAIYKALNDGLFALRQNSNEIGSAPRVDVVFSTVLDDFSSQMADILTLLTKMIQTSRLIALTEATKADFEAVLVLVMTSVKSLRASLDALAAAAPY
jgi:hypothetical protein